jgi:hypothetical protein
MPTSGVMPDSAAQRSTTMRSPCVMLGISRRAYLGGAAA